MESRTSNKAQSWNFQAFYKTENQEVYGSGGKLNITHFGTTLENINTARHKLCVPVQHNSYTAIQLYSTVITLLWLAIPTEDVCIQSDAAMQDSLIDKWQFERIWKETIWANRGSSTWCNLRGWKKKTTVTLIPADVRKRSFSDTRQEVIKLKCNFSNVRSVRDRLPLRSAGAWHYLCLCAENVHDKFVLILS